MTHRPVSHVIPLPIDRVVRVLLRLSADTADLDTLLDIEAIGVSLRTHRDSAFAGKPVRDVAADLLAGLCAPRNFTGLDPGSVAGLTETVLTQFAELNNCIFDWKCAPALDELNNLIDETLAGDATGEQCRQWTAKYLLPDDETQSWDFVAPSPPVDVDLEAAVLVPMTGLTRIEQVQYAHLALAVHRELETRGFKVHCPALSPAVGLTDEQVAVTDVIAVSGAAMIAVLIPKPALGVGIGVGVTALSGNRPPVLILGPRGTNVSPFAGILEHSVLSPATTPEEMRTQICRFLDHNLDRIIDHARQVQERRTRHRSRFEAFRLALALGTELAIPSNHLTDRVKTLLSSDIDVFASATTLNDEIDMYLVDIEQAIASGADTVEEGTAIHTNTSIDRLPESSAADAPQEGQAHPPNGPGSAAEPAATQNLDWPQPTHRPRTRTDPVYEAVAFPRPTDNDLEQLALFGVGPKVHSATPRQNRPAGWKESALLTTKEIGAGLRATARVRLPAPEVRDLFDYAAGVRYDQQVLAAVGGGVSYVPLTSTDQWLVMIDDLRSER